MSRILWIRVDDPSIKDNELLSAVRQTTKLIATVYQEYVYLSEDDIKHILCTAAVNYLGSFRAIEMIASDIYQQPQAI